MFLESFLNFNDSEAVSYKHVTYIKKGVLFIKINLLMSQKVGPKSVPTKTNDLEQ